jgi:hypothetical protein
MDRPTDRVPWIALKLKDDTELWGYLKYYTPQEKSDYREIALQGDVNGEGLKIRRAGSAELTPLDTWKVVIVRGDQISLMKVDYLQGETAAKGLACQTGSARQPLDRAVLSAYSHAIFRLNFGQSHLDLSGQREQASDH